MKIKSFNLLLATCILLASNAIADELSPVEGIPDGYELIEGDILVRKQTVRLGGHTALSLFTTNINEFWPNGIVPYEFSTNVSATNRQLAIDAMAMWENAASVDFRPRNSEAGYLFIQTHAANNNSAVGRQGRMQVVNIADWDRFVIAHELAHALGFWHEQSRDDRTNYIEVHLENVQDVRRDNFNIHNEASHYGPYDFDSVMHYWSGAFSTNGQPSIVVRPPFFSRWQNNIGQRWHLSEMDQRIMGFLYAPGDWRFLHPKAGSAGNGGFLQPYTSFSQAVANTPANSTLWIGPGAYSAAGMTISKPMTVKAAIADLQLQPDGSLGPSPSGYATLQ